MSQDERRARLRTALPAVVWFLFIMTLLSLPGTSFPVVRIWQPDKIAHILLFGVQQALLWLALELPLPRFSSPAKALFASFAATVAFGILSEVYQDVATSRMLDPYDMIANTVGALLSTGIILGTGTQRVLNRARRLFRLDT
ncbi:MAG: VanZ family protein [Bacteroidia bacterium]|nr:VanZ family protein [Bacteroidia bacterium]